MKAVILGVAVAAVGGGYVLTNWMKEADAPAPQAQPTGRAMVSIQLPETLSEQAQIGKTAFDAKCAACHGADADGQVGVAPPLIHKIYEPSHHGDESFQRAVAQGVRAHHWRFGDMPPVDGLTRGDVQVIVAYIREVQRANGIN